MGCATSKAAEVQTSRMENRMQNMMGTFMQQAQQMQQESIARQQQMARDDPECKALLDRMYDLQRRSIAAYSTGDQAAISRIQYESMELNKNPKFIEMMMPTASMLNNLGGAARTGNASIFHTMNHSKVKTTGSKHHTHATSSYTSSTHAPSYMSSANYNNDEEYEIPYQNHAYNDTSMFSQMTMDTGMGGGGFDFGTTASTGDGGVSSGFDFGSSGGCNDNYGSSSCGISSSDF